MSAPAIGNRSMSLGEFLSAGHLSNASLRFDGGDAIGAENGYLSSGSSEGDVSNEGGVRALHATRLALMLAREMARLDEDSVDASPLQLDHFSVRLQQLGEAAANNDPVGEDGDDDLDSMVAAIFGDPDEDEGQQDAGGVPGAAICPLTAREIMTVLGVDFDPTPPSNGPALPQSRLPSLQILGNHLLTIYSRGNRQTIMSSIHQATEPRAEEASEASERHPPKPKQPALEGSSVFAALLESGEHPTSVCRLLADLVDPHAERPLRSFDDAIHDLEQMAALPHIFLRDPGGDFVSSRVHFGQRCYGRAAELTTLLALPARLDPSRGPSSVDKVEVALVSGVAGSGKTILVQNLGSFLESLGWTVFRATFEREREHSSREIVASLFEELVAHVVIDAERGQRAIEAISEALDRESLASLANFIPCIRDLFPDVDGDSPLLAEAEVSHWQLFILLSKLLGVLLTLDHRMMICLDNLQWCDGSTIELIKELIGCAGQGRQNILFVGMYRDDEVDGTHPLAGQVAALRNDNGVRLTQLKLSSLLKDDIADMIMSELRLPRRLVRGLGDVVHKRTSGHALFVVQVLNSLVRDSTIAFSPRKRRFDWDETKIASLKTLDSVASLIVANLSSLQPEALQSLRIISCFGVQCNLSLLEHISGCPFVPEEGIGAYLPGLAKAGVVEESGPSIFFAHDLIQQRVYNHIPAEERMRLHLDIGTAIAVKIGLDSSISKQSLEAAVEGLVLDDESNDGLSYPLVAIATNQINFAGPESVSERSQQIQFAGWNLRAGNDAKKRTNFQAALHYYKSGMQFLGGDDSGHLCAEDSGHLCHDLHEGAALALFAMGDCQLAAEQASIIIDHVAFEDSLRAQYIRIRSLDSLGRYEECVSTGLDVLRRLEFDIPTEPNPADVIKTLRATANAASAYSFDQLTTVSEITDSKKRDTYKIAEGLIVGCYRSASPSTPLVACAFVNHSLTHGICDQTAVAYMLLGYLRMSLEGKWVEGKHWGSVVLRMLEKAKYQTLSMSRMDTMCTMYVNVMYYPFTISAFRLLKLYERQMALGDVESAYHSLTFHLTISLYGGENLSLLQNSMQDLVRSMAKHSKEGAKMALSNLLLVDCLMGNSEREFPDLDGIYDERTLLADSQVKTNVRLVEEIHTRRFIAAFWMGDYAEALKCSKEIEALPSFRMHKIQLVFHSFFLGLISFQRYRDGEGEQWLEGGKKALEKMEVWAVCCPQSFENKWRLLEAECFASNCHVRAAKNAYERSILTARGHGLVHEMALAFEMYGKYLQSIVELPAATEAYQSAHTFYVQWGATAKAERLRKEHNLEVQNGLSGLGDAGSTKRKA